MKDENHIILIIVFVFTLALVYFSRPEATGFIQERSEVGRYQLYLDQQVIFDTVDGTLYSTQTNKDNEFTVLGEIPDIFISSKQDSK